MQKMDEHHACSVNAYMFFDRTYIYNSVLYIVIHCLIWSIHVAYCRHFLFGVFGALYCIPLLKYAKIQGIHKERFLVAIHFSV